MHKILWPSEWADTNECLYDSVLWLSGVRCGGVAVRHGEARQNVTVSWNTLAKATSKQGRQVSFDSPVGAIRRVRKELGKRRTGNQEDGSSRR